MTDDPHPESVPADEVGSEERPLPPPSPLDALITELVAIVPEVKDTLVSVVDALLEVARAVIDAADRACSSPTPTESTGRGEPGVAEPGDAGPGDADPGDGRA